MTAASAGWLVVTRFKVGQNLYTQSQSHIAHLKLDWEEAINQWYGEVTMVPNWAVSQNFSFELALSHAICQLRAYSIKFVGVFKYWSDYNQFDSVYVFNSDFTVFDGIRISVRTLQLKSHDQPCDFSCKVWLKS